MSIPVPARIAQCRRNIVLDSIRKCGVVAIKYERRFDVADIESQPFPSSPGSKSPPDVDDVQLDCTKILSNDPDRVGGSREKICGTIGLGHFSNRERHEVF